MTTGQDKHPLYVDLDGTLIHSDLLLGVNFDWRVGKTGTKFLFDTLALRTELLLGDLAFMSLANELV